MENTVCFDRKIKIDRAHSRTDINMSTHTKKKYFVHFNTQHKTIFETFNKKLCEINIPDTDLDMEAEVHKDYG